MSQQQSDGAPVAVGAQVKSAQGEDRSDDQAVLPWTANSFGFAKATEGTSWSGKTFAANWAALKAEGKPRGAYHYLHPYLDPVAQAEFFLSVVQPAGLEPGDMLVVDSEIFPGQEEVLESGNSNGMGPDVTISGTLSDASAVGDCTRKFLETLHSVAYPHHPRVVYTNMNGLQFLGPCHKYQLWIAHPSSIAPTNAQVSPWEKWQFWQWQFGGGPGGGDRDAFNGTAADLHAWLNGYLKAGAALQSDQTAP